METISRDNATLYEFGRDMDPILTVEEGESFKVETWDAFEGVLFEHGLGEFTTEDILALTAPPPAFDGNPVAGPIYIEGVQPGDTLAIHIEKISPERGFTTTLEEFGCLVGKSGWEDCQVNHAHEVKLEPGSDGSMTNGTARLEINDHEWMWELNPHIGPIATPPGRTVQETVTTQGPWGGNRDVRDAAEGSTVFLNSFNEGVCYSSATSMRHRAIPSIPELQLNQSPKSFCESKLWMSRYRVSSELKTMIALSMLIQRKTQVRQKTQSITASLL